MRMQTPLTMISLILSLLTPDFASARFERDRSSSFQEPSALDASGLSEEELRLFPISSLPIGTPIRFVRAPYSAPVIFGSGHETALIEALSMSVNTDYTLSRSGDLTNFLRLTPEITYRVKSIRMAEAMPIRDRLLSLKTGKTFQQVTSNTTWALDFVPENGGDLLTLTCREVFGPTWSLSRGCTTAESCRDILMNDQRARNYPDLPSQVRSCTLAHVKNVFRVTSPLLNRH